MYLVGFRAFKSPLFKMHLVAFVRSSLSTLMHRRVNSTHTRRIYYAIQLGTPTPITMLVSFSEENVTFHIAPVEKIVA